jgi:hypothetical protein
MAILAQHGYGKGDKLDLGLAAGSIGGVIFSPKDEVVGSLEQMVRQYRAQYGARVQIAIDPQIHAFQVAVPSLGRLLSYPYAPSAPLTRADFTSPGFGAALVAAALDWQASLPVTYLISPSVEFDDFNDAWCQIAQTLAGEAIAEWRRHAGWPSLLISFVFSDRALQSRTRLNDFLNDISRLDTAGFYLVLKRTGQVNPPALSEVQMEALYTIAHSLGEVNQFTTIFGYLDCPGVCLQVFANVHSATGWYANLRHYTDRRFASGGIARQPLPRYTSRALRTPILVVPELSAAHQLGLKQALITGSPYDGDLAANDPATQDWPLPTATLHHWYSLTTMTAPLMAGGSLGARLDRLAQNLQDARDVYRAMRRAGLIFSTDTGPRDVQVQEGGLSAFRARVGL